MLTGIGDKRRTVQLRQDDDIIATVDLRSIQLGGAEYLPKRTGGTFKRAYEIFLGETSMAEIVPVSAVKLGYRIATAGQEWTLKPAGMFTRKVTIAAEDNAAAGAFAPRSYFRPWFAMDIEMPSGAGPETQAFLLWVFLKIVDDMFSD